MKAPVWTPEKLKALSRTELEQLRSNADRLSRPEVVEACDEELNSRAEPKRKSYAHTPKTLETDVVTGYHFVCQDDRGVQLNPDGTFWSGSWVVAEGNVERSLQYGAYLALHDSKSEPSYRQGKIIDYRKTMRSMVSKTEDGIEFKVQPEQDPITWVGRGAGEKGYKWTKLSTKSADAHQDKRK